ncbi:hypothetical protein E2C01_038175 [Portunus trituberculatus]|uniref:Uncharacterized protein n=1 Tax=Portunus trituberculatus TaxID=210409 RepID=A0A5B7FDG9_PORTR|nr:hypothetical protein [Portunus trituberculatus]
MVIFICDLQECEEFLQLVLQGCTASPLAKISSTSCFSVRSSTLLIRPLSLVRDDRWYPSDSEKEGRCCFTTSAAL